MNLRKLISTIIVFALIATSIQSPVYAFEGNQLPWMSKPGVMVHLSPAFTPAYLKGIIIHPEHAFKFDFIVDKGDEVLSDDNKRIEYTKLMKYFLASLAIPDEHQWVNLSPYEKDRIIKDDFGKTQMGRDLLAQDYMLKQITSSLINPQQQIGKRFWDKVYEQAWQRYQTTEIPISTFNKVWIVPDEALIFEQGNTAYVLKHHLKVMLEEDYLAIAKNQSQPKVRQPGDMFQKEQQNVSSSLLPSDSALNTKAPQVNPPSRTVSPTSSLSSQIIKEIIIPELEKEVNEGKNFAVLRQIYSGMLLAAWYKRVLKESLLAQIYADKSKVVGVDQLSCREPGTTCHDNEKIYKNYLNAFKLGVFNFIQEDVDTYSKATIPRKYFSGGMQSFNTLIEKDGLDSLRTRKLDHAQITNIFKQMSKFDLIEGGVEELDMAMSTEKTKRVSVITAIGLIVISASVLSLQDVKDRPATPTEIRKMVGDLTPIVVPVSLQGTDWEVKINNINTEKKTLEAILQNTNDIPNRDDIRKKILAARNGHREFLLPFQDLPKNTPHHTELLKMYGEVYKSYITTTDEIPEESELDWFHTFSDKLEDSVRNVGQMLKRKKSSSQSLNVTNTVPVFPQTNTSTEATISKTQGGIDFNAEHLNLQIKRDGHGVPLPNQVQNLRNITIKGLMPVIFNIIPLMESSIFCR